MSPSRPLRPRVALLATLALLGGIAAAGKVVDRPLPVRAAAAGPLAGVAPGAVAQAAFAAG